MLKVEKITPALGGIVEGIDFSKPINETNQHLIYEALLEHQVIFFRGAEITPSAHLDFAKSFGQIDEPHPIYPHVEGYENIVKLENNAQAPPDTNSWHTDLTFKLHQPFASILVARTIPEVGGDTLWASLSAAYERLPERMKTYLGDLEAIHDMGDFRNSFAANMAPEAGRQKLNEAIGRFGHNIRPLIQHHPVNGKTFLNFNEAFVNHIIGMTTNESNSLKTWLANHMNRPEIQLRWKWQEGDVAMWDNRITMHYAVADYLPAYRCMNRITVISDKRERPSQVA
jgi:taurine dioxygenase